MNSSSIGRTSSVCWKICSAQINQAIDEMNMIGRLFIRYASKDKPIHAKQAIISPSVIMVCLY